MARARLASPERFLLEVADLLLEAASPQDVLRRIDAVLSDRLGAECELVERDPAPDEVYVPVLRDGRRVASVVLRRPRSMSPHEIELVKGVADRAWSRLEQLRAVEALEDSRADANARLVALAMAATARERAFEDVERVLRENVARYQTLFDESAASLWEVDFSKAIPLARVEGADIFEAIARVVILAVNRRTLEKFEAENIDEFRRRLPELFLLGTLLTFGDILKAMAEEHGSFEAVTICRTLSGKRIHVNLRASVIPGHEKDWSRAVVSMVDVSSLKEAEERLISSLAEKEVLLREVHHRVKNNLQVVSSLLNLQSQHVTDPAAKVLLASTRGRVQSMALIHERLYQAKDLSHVSFDRYAEDLVTSLLHSTNADARGISSRVDARGVKLGVDRAIPCGFIVNELVTNSLKHAFPAGRGGSVHVALRSAPEGRYELLVEDDGVGLPEGLDPRNTASLGLDLVFTFADQLEAEVVVRRERGTSFTFRFADALPAGASDVEK